MTDMSVAAWPYQARGWTHISNPATLISHPHSGLCLTPSSSDDAF